MYFIPLLTLQSYDGQAGAAAITLDGTPEAVFINNLYAGLKKTGLPSYAMPRLVRITPEYVFHGATAAEPAILTRV
jgi:hypothetical protein